MNTDLVTIIIPIYNAENSIEYCINSVIRQTYKNLQIICVDDGSLDNSVNIIKLLLEMDNRIELIQKTNGGVSKARNVGLKNARGKYIQFVDSDDVISEKMTETLVNNIRKHEADLVICGYKINGTEHKCSLKEKEYKNINMFFEDFFDIYNSTYLNPPWNKLFIKDKILNLYDEKMSIGEDLVFNLNYIKDIECIKLLDECLYNYKADTENSLTTRFHENGFESLKKVILTVKDTLPAKYYLAIISKLYNCYFRDYVRCLDSLINKSNKKFNEIRKSIDKWRNDELILDVIKYANNKSILNKILRKNNITIMISYFKIIQIKRNILHKIKKIIMNK